MKPPYCLLSVWEMLDLPLGRLSFLYLRLGNFAQAIAQGIQHGLAWQQLQADWAVTVSEAEEFAALCEVVSLTTTKDAMDEVLNKMRSRKVVNGACTIQFEDLRKLNRSLTDAIGCMRHESKRKILLILPPEKIRLYEQLSPLWGQEVAEKFGSIAYEIVEAGKCLALNRSTASGFHSIRALEAGLRAVARCLDVPDPTKGAERNWHNALGKIKSKIDARWPSSTRIRGDGAFFERIHGALEAMQNPYRNATMHFDRIFTEEEAEETFVMIKGLMATIASRIDENGNLSDP